MERLERIVVHLLVVVGSWAVCMSVSSRLLMLSVAVVGLGGGVVMVDDVGCRLIVGVDEGGLWSLACGGGC